MKLQLQTLAMSFCVKTSVDTVNSAVRVAAQDEASLLASPVASRCSFHEGLML